MPVAGSGPAKQRGVGERPAAAGLLAHALPVEASSPPPGSGVHGVVARGAAEICFAIAHSGRV